MHFRYLPELIFWVSWGLLFYTFPGYGVIIAALARWRPGAPRCADADFPTPSVCVVVVACNAEEQIANRLRNLLASRFPPEKLRIILVSDGSTDRTAAAARAVGDPRIEILERPVRAGKAARINLALEHATADLIVFADARQQFEPDAIGRLAAHFSDPSVGAVSGDLEIASSASGPASGVDVYWRYEKWLRAAESRFGSCIGCTGAIYALRRRLFAPIPEDTLLDDVVIPLHAAQRGTRVLHDPAARAFDPQALEPAAEMRRKQRTLGGGFQMLFRYPRWLLPWGHPLWWQIISHKYLRLLLPLLFLTAALGAGLLAAQPFYAGCLAAQLLIVLAASLCLLPAARRWKICRLPAGWLFLNLQVIRGLRYYLTGAGRHGWQ